ncbi:uncharacterized protein LOC131689268 isoform X6 [Topomyia yanbarensis]|uniref:uncharacterized protein LOC131689268 isoform X6 n=1 Tax=Topomyia yanbarensis TaxID=2498891 RepID=UPI00273BFE58|nr:uncharacterized protein LOC131689268 isoform X6 [Topomyia yanbarensis]
MQKALETLIKIDNNLKKSITKKFSNSNLIEKEKLCKANYRAIQEYLLINEDTLTSEKLFYFKKSSRTLNFDITTAINKKLHKFKIKFRLKGIILAIIFTNRLNKLKIMANFDIKTAAKLASIIPLYDGNKEGAKGFIDAVNFINTIVTEAQKPTAVQLVLTKLTGKARNLFTAVPASLVEIALQIQLNCTDKNSSDSAENNLKNIKHNSDPRTFAKSVDELSNQLANAYIREAFPGEVAKKKTQKAVIQALISGSRHPETKMMLRVAKFDTLSDAIDLMVENETCNEKESATLLNINKNTNRWDNRVILIHIETCIITNEAVVITNLNRLDMEQIDSRRIDKTCI